MKNLSFPLVIAMALFALQGCVDRVVVSGDAPAPVVYSGGYYYRDYSPTYVEPVPAPPFVGAVWIHGDWDNDYYRIHHRWRYRRGYYRH